MTLIFAALCAVAASVITQRYGGVIATQVKRALCRHLSLKLSTVGTVAIESGAADVPVQIECASCGDINHGVLDLTEALHGAVNRK